MGRENRKSVGTMEVGRRQPEARSRVLCWSVTVALAAQVHGAGYPASPTRVPEPTAKGNLGIFIVTPAAPAQPSMAESGSLSRSFVVYRLEHKGDEASGPIDWVAWVTQEWIDLGVSDPQFGHLEPGERATVIVRMDATRLPPLPSDTEVATMTGEVVFENRTHSVTTRRTIAVDVVRSQASVSTVSISAGDVQPNGPRYTFEIAPHPVTNREFAAFLNDAIYHTDHARGGAMYFDLETGDVYMHTSSVGADGVGANGHTIKLFAMDQAPGMRFVDTAYSVMTTPIDYAEHPVTGVSWYGAVKYCNWLTIDQGYGLDERCYSEGTSGALSDWRPIVIDAVAWRSRDLNDAEARRLVRACKGYRLPMDDGYANADPTVDAADAYNEWFKAAAWKKTLGRNTVYGFGRDVLSGADANFRCSGDPFEAIGQCQVGGTTPVNLFAHETMLQFQEPSPLPLSLGGRGGSRGSSSSPSSPEGRGVGGVDVRGVPGAVFAPLASENAFGLFDMTGNVHQWMQGRYAPSAVLDQRTLRGGSWNEPANAASLKNAGRTVWATPNTAHREIGFRVVRSTARSGDLDASGVIDLDDVPAIGTCFTGPSVVPLGGCQLADLDEDGDIDLEDLSTTLRAFGVEE